MNKIVLREVAFCVIQRLLSALFHCYCYFQRRSGFNAENFRRLMLKSQVSAAVVLCAFSLSLFFSAAGFTADSPPRRKSIKKTMEKPLQELKKVTKPVEEAVTKTAETAIKEAKVIAKEAHSLGGKFLQGLINIMTAVSPGKTRVYLPAAASDPNAGATIGFLPVFLFVDDKEQIRHILAPLPTYNRFFGFSMAMNYYWYPRPRAQLTALGAYAQETNRKFIFGYEDPKFYLDWLYFKFEFRALQEGAYRFFGFGPASPHSAQTNYTLRDNHLQLFVGINFLERMRFTLAHRFRFTNVVDGPISSLPKISSFAPRPLGVEDPKTIFAQRFALSYDSRDLPIAPVKGHWFNFFTEFSGHLGGDTRYERIGTELRGFYPLRNNRFITGWRFLAEGQTGTNTPFYEQSLLGGKNSLRGFGEARFVDKNKILFSLEERIRFYTLHAFNVNVDFEVTPYYETGTVYNHAGAFRTADLHHVWGIGFRSVVKPNVVGVVDLGFGSEGTALFVGLEYPF